MTLRLFPAPTNSGTTPCPAAKRILRGSLRRLTAFVLLLGLLGPTVMANPNAPKHIYVALGELGTDVRYALVRNDFLFSMFSFESLRNYFAGEPDGARSFDRIVVSPADEKGEHSVLHGGTVHLSAVAYRGEEPVNGVGFRWTIAGVDPSGPERSLPNGHFRATRVGSFRATASSGGRSATVTVNVLPNEGFHIQRILDLPEDSRSERDRQHLQRLRERGMLSTRAIESRGEHDPAVEGELHRRDLELRAAIRARQEARRGGGQAQGIQSGPATEPPTDDEGSADWGVATGPSRGPGAGVKNSSRADRSEPAPASPVFRRPADEDGWDGGDWHTADDPGNAVGRPSGSAPEAGAGNGNFQIAAPVMSLPGRGIDVNLALTYNSRLWNKSGTVMKYDSDKGWPAPGWNLGFGKMIYMGATGGCMIATADGTRRSHSGTNTTVSFGTNYTHSYVGKTSDSSFIDYSCTYQSSTAGTTLTGTATLADGTRITYGSPTGKLDQIYPTKIADAQGNYILITYLGNQGPNIDTITDTLGRVVAFHYDSGRLVSVSGPGYNGSTRTYVRLHYKSLTLSYAFGGGLTADTPTNAPWVIDGIYYPGTNTGFWFGDTDSYSSFGMIAKVHRQRGMNWSGSPGTEGTIGPGTTYNTASYNFPLTAGGPSISDAPTYTTLTETWDKMDTSAVVTDYAKSTSGGNETITITRPDGAVEKQTSDSNGYWFKNEVLSGSTVLSSSLTNFAAGAYGTSRPTNIYATDSLGQTTRTEITYGANYNQVTAQKEYDYNGTVYRQTKYTYENHAGYIGRHIFNLVKSVEVTDASTGKFARMDYEYDNNVAVYGTSNHGLVQIDQSDPADEIVMHDHTSDPWTDETIWVEGESCILWQWNYPECTYEGQEIGQWEDGYFIVHDLCHESCADYEDVQVSAYNDLSIYRGNVTRVTSYADASTPSGGEVHDYEYDIAGNRRTATTNCCEEMSFSYTAATQYSQPESVTKGSPNPASPHRMTQSAVYDFDTGAVKSATDFNGQTTTYTYDAAMRPYLVAGPTGAYTTTDYGDDDFITTKSSHNAASWTVPDEVVSKSYSELNGRGQPVVSGYYVDGTNRNDTAIQYDEMGRRKKVSMPYSSSGTPAHWTEYTYDHLGRVSQTTAPDGSTSKSFFNEIPRPDSANPFTTHKGQTVRSQDAWGRERWARTDAFGRLVEVVEPNPSGSVMSTSINAALSSNGSTATASGTYAGLSPGAAINGLRHTNNNWNGNGGWGSAVGSTTSNPQWLEVNFGQNRTISQIDVFTLRNTQNYNTDPTLSETFTTWGIRDFKVQYWDGSAWVDVANVTSNNKVWRQFTFTAVTTQKVRVYVTGVPGPNTHARIVELEAWTAPQSIAASGSVFDPGSLRTEYAYDRLDQLTQMAQGAQTRSFKYDALGRLTRQKLAEQTAMINDAGIHVESGGTGPLLWSDAFSYDGRGNLIQRTDARGVKTNFSYDLPAGGGSDPLDRLHGISYDKTGAASTPVIHEAPDVTVEYETAGDKSRVRKVTAAGVSTEENAYDSYGRVTDYTVTMLTRTSYPFATSYQYDTVGRLTEIRYPKQYGMAGDPRKVVAPSYDEASRLSQLRVDAATQLNELVYNPLGQVTSLRTAAATGNAHVEQYAYDAQTGLLTSQKVVRANTGTTLLDLSYGYNRGNSVGTLNGKTGQLTHMIDHLDRNRDRVYEHDALGRLIKAKGGAATGITGVTADWTQDYAYDRYGNKTGTTKTGITADSNPVPLDGLASLAYIAASNRVDGPDWQYDLAGNQTRGQNEAGAWLRFEYDEAGRKVKTKDDSGNNIEVYSYGASRHRLINETTAGRTYYAWGGQAVLAEYFETSTTPTWQISYIHSGSRLLSTFTKSGGSEVEEYHHPDRLGTKLVTKPSLNTSYQQSALPFGTALPAESSGFSNQVFTSYDRSMTTGVDYAVNRTFSPGQSRFMQVDPIGMLSAEVGDPQSNNLYAYVQNSPTDFIDSLGLNEQAPGEACAPNPNSRDSDGNPVYDGTVGSDGVCRRNSQAATNVYWEGGWVIWGGGTVWVPAGGYPGDVGLGGGGIGGGGNPSGAGGEPPTDPCDIVGNPSLNLIRRGARAIERAIGQDILADALKLEGNFLGGSVSLQNTRDGDLVISGGGGGGSERAICGYSDGRGYRS